MHEACSGGYQYYHIDVVEKKDAPIIIVDSIQSGLDFRPHHSHSFTTRALPIKGIGQIFESLMLSAIVSSDFLVNNERLSGTIAGVGAPRLRACLDSDTDTT